MKPFLPIFLFFSCCLCAQPTAVWFDKVGDEEGLSAPDITAICRDHRGFLWLGTASAGLNRYDGWEMKVYQHNDDDSTSLCGDRIVSILEDAEGYIWVGTWEGISRLNPANGCCQNFMPQNGRLLDARENCLFPDPKGHVWTSNLGGVERYDPVAHCFVPVPGSHAAHISGQAAFDSAETLWGGGLGLHRIEPQSGTFEQYLPNPQAGDWYFGNQNSTSVKIDHFGNIWVRTWGGGLLRFHPENGRFEKLEWAPKPEHPNLRNIPFDLAEAFSPEGKRSLWIAAEMGLLKFPLAPPDFPSMSAPHQMIDEHSMANFKGEPHVLNADREGNLWVGTSSQGLFRYKVQQENFQVSKIPPEIETLKIGTTPSGDLLAMSIGNPFVILNSDFTPKKAFDGLMPGMNPGESRDCHAVTKDESTGIIYLGTFDGLIAYEEKTGITRWFSCSSYYDSTGLLSPLVMAIFPLGNNKLLLGLWICPLQIIDASTGKNVKIFREALQSAAILKTRDEKIWILAIHRLFLFDTQKEETTELTPNATWTYIDVYVDARNRTWLATNKGLCRYDLSERRITERYTIADGLPNNEIQQITSDSLGRLWLLTAFGLCCFDPETRRCHTLERGDGLMFGKQPEKMQMLPDGRILLVCPDRHLEIFRPELIPIPPPSRLYIMGLKINGRDTLPELPFERIGEIRLRPGQNALTFSYTAIDLEAFGKTRFLYRLDGLQREWTRAGKIREATFVNLAPGVYTFRVRPEDAGDSDAWDATLRVVVTDYFWQRAWFRNGSIVVVSGLLFSLFFYGYNRQLRLRHLKAKAQLDLMEERNRISRDLHDDLGSGLGAIGLLSDIALSKTGDAEMRIEVGKIAESSRDLSAKIREIIWAASARNDTLEKLVGYLHQYAVSLFAGSDIELRAHLPADLPDATVPGERRRAVFLAFKEALNNIVRHAGATQADIQFTYTDQQLTVRIGDNGRGFDPLTVGDSGNGLVNMRQRVEGAGGQFRLESGGNGTVVTFILPL